MNERYLFRAKRVDNGKWISGNLIHTKNGYCICKNPFECMTQYSSANGESFGFGGFVLVDPSTICQCTGLRDKKGDLIWENDILLGHLDDVYPDDITYACVIWNDNGFYLKENFCDDIDLIDENDKQYFEVCGNIFDNPELLQEA